MSKLTDAAQNAADYIASIADESSSQFTGDQGGLSAGQGGRAGGLKGQTKEAAIPDVVSRWERYTPIEGAGGVVSYANPVNGETWFHPDWNQSSHRSFQPDKMKTPEQVMAFALAQEKRNRKNAERAAAAAVAPSFETAEAPAATPSDAVGMDLGPVDQSAVDAAISESDMNSLPVGIDLGPVNPVDYGVLQGAVPQQAPVQGSALAPSQPSNPQYGRASGYNGTNYNPQQPGYPPQQPQQPQQQQQAQQEDLTPRQIIDRLWKDLFYRDRKSARRKNRQLAREAERLNMPLAEYLAATGKRLDPAAFDDFRKIQDEMYGEIPEADAAGAGRMFKDHGALWKMMDNLVYDMQIGFFHVQGEQLAYDKDGTPYVRYSKRMQSKIGDMEQMFGLRASDSGRRTVFRMVRLYASMSTDFSGRMFNMDKEEWSMTEDEFIMVCNLMMESAEKDHKNHNPFRMVQKNATIGGTRLYPSGVIPMVVAAEICNGNSIITVSPTELIEAARAEWVGFTYPQMRHDLSVNRRVRAATAKKRRKAEKRAKALGREVDESQFRTPNLQAQRVVVEGMQQALARIDGISADKFSTSYNVDTTDRYFISEYLDESKMYATAMNGNYDSEKVSARSRAKASEWSERYSGDGYNVTKRNPDGTIELNERVVETNSQWGLRVFGSYVQINALIGQVGIAIGQVAEKAATVATTGAWTSVVLRHYNKEDANYEMSKNAVSFVTSDEFIEAMSAAKMLCDVYGPGTLRLFRETGRPMTRSEAGNWLINEFLADAPSEKKAAIESTFHEWVNKFMAGDFALNKSDCLNWYKSYLIHNGAQAKVQRQLAEKGERDKMGIALTAREIEDTMIASGDPARWFADAVGTDNGIGAYIAMRGNSIANMNPASFAVTEFLARHRVGNAAILAFLDHFPHYGINMLLNLVPFCKTIMYLEAKRGSNGNKATSSDLVIGGNFGSVGNQSLREAAQNDPGFRTGLLLNLSYDAFAMGRIAIVQPFIKVVAMLILGVQLPDDKKNLTNFEAYKVGGIEFNSGFWMNDILLWSDPIACAVVATIVTGDSKIGKDVFINSVSQMLDGNVLIDAVNVITNWQEDLHKMQAMADDPNYDGPPPTESALTELLWTYLTFAKNSVTPFAPLNRTIANSTLLRGEDALTPDPNREWNTDSQWAIDNKISRYIEDDSTRRRNKLTMYDPILGLGLDWFLNMMNPDENAHHFWASMPPRSSGDPVTLAYAEAVHFDYSERGDLTEQEYQYEKFQEYRKYVEENFSGPVAAAEAGFYLPNENRFAFQNVINAECNMLDKDLMKRVASGEIIYDSDEYWEIAKSNSAYKKELTAFSNNWLWNDAIPAGYERYDQLLTDYDVRYIDTVTNKPTNAWDWFWHQDTVVREYYPKGNHPTSVLPYTWVDTKGRGYNAETLNYWETPNSDLEAIRNSDIGEHVISMGRWAGKTVNDLIFGGEQPDYEPFSRPDDYTNPDESTMSERSWVAHKIPADYTLKQDREDSDGGIYGEAGQLTEEEAAALEAMFSGKLVPADAVAANRTYWPSGSYGYTYSGGSSSYNYNPRIYSTSGSVGSSRPSTMYSKAPYTTRPSYLSPGFSTKGSREAYRRQDI